MSAYLTYEERLEIEAGLKEHKAFGEIARQIGKDRTTVAKEIKRNAVDGTDGFGCWEKGRKGSANIALCGY